MRSLMGLLTSLQLMMFSMVSHATSTEIIGFLTNYGWSTYSPSSAELDRLTQVNLFPYIPSASGMISTSWNCSTVESLKTAGKKVYFTLGGADYSGGFESAISNNLNTFVANIVNQIKSCDFDGVDIDWEYPNATGQAAKFKTFLAALREKMNSEAAGAKISIDVPTQWLDNEWGAEPFEVGSSVYDHADYINVMNYDDYRTSTKPNHSGWVKSYDNMEFWLKRVPAAKLVMGVPFYGRPVTGEKVLNYSQTWAPHDSIDDYNGYYYNGPEMMYDKALYAKNSGYHGLMYWAINDGTSSMDKNAATASSLLYQIHKGLTDPDRVSGGKGMAAFEPWKKFDNTIIYHDGFYWRQKYGGFRNFPPYAAGSDQVEFVWNRNVEPWCDSFWRWQPVCSYSDQHWVEHNSLCYELKESVTSTVGAEPNSIEGTNEWDEVACTPCEVIDYGEDWSEYCIYRPGEVIAYGGSLWQANDNTSYGIDSIPLNITPNVNNDIWWTNIGEISSSDSETSSDDQVSSEVALSSSSVTESLFADLNPLFELRAQGEGLSWVGFNSTYATLKLVNSAGKILSTRAIEGQSGGLNWNQPLSSGAYFVRLEAQSGETTLKFYVK